MILLLALLLQGPPPQAGPGPTPPPSHPTCPGPEDTTATPCRDIGMLVHVGGPRSFTASDIGKPLAQLDPSAWCEGHVLRGSVRYFTTGTAPSSLVGILVPGVPERPPSAQEDPAFTLEEGGAIVLYNAELVRGFKAVAATSITAEIGWTCQL